MKFDGKKIRDKILGELKSRVEKLNNKPKLAVISIGDDFATARYIEAKKRVTEKLGIGFDLIKYPADAAMEEIKQKVIELNNNQKITGIMIQLPLPKQINRTTLIESIDSKKDVDGLRFCAGLPSLFQPPTVLAILEALKESKIDIKNRTVAVIGQGFLVGAPLVRTLKDQIVELRTADSKTSNLSEVTADSDVVISAVGVSNFIKADMVKNDVILIDAGTSESNGSLSGDIDPEAYQKSSFYTPVPGGIGPLTVAKLFSNLVVAAERQK